MKETIFRQKSLDRVNSPDSLNDYLKVTNATTWLLLASIISLLVGTIIWGYFGRLETTIQLQAISSNGEVTCSVMSDNLSSISVGMEVRIGNDKGRVTKINNSNDGTYTLTIDMELNDGVYSAELITESISPLSLLFN